MEPRRTLLHRLATIWEDITSIEPKSYPNAYKTPPGFMLFTEVIVAQMAEEEQKIILSGLTDAAVHVAKERRERVRIKLVPHCWTVWQ